MQELPLGPYHIGRSATFRAEAGWSIPASYGSLDVEVRAVHELAGMIDFSDRAKIELTGSERLPFLDGLVTADLKTLSPGTSAYALLLNEKSRVLGDLRVYILPDSFVLDLGAAQKESVLRILEKARVSDDVEFRDLGAVGHIEVLGLASSGAIDKVLGGDVRGLADGSFLTVPLSPRGRAYVRVIRSPPMNGYAVWSPDSSLSREWEAFSRAGVEPVGRDAMEVLRIEAGIPGFGADMGEDTLALEVAPESAISFTKGCYVGQEIVARGTYVGQVRRKLLGLRVDGEIVPARGDRVSNDGHEVGRVTSAAWSPTFRHVIALGILRLDAVSQGDRLSIGHGARNLPARIGSLPFS
jgi:folate-binding protein YgfZ